MPQSRARRLPTMAATALLMACALLAPTAPSAAAGRYHVYSCRTPHGGVAPTDGWSRETRGTAVHADEKCAQGGALVAALSDGATHEVGTDLAKWTFSAPLGDTVAAAKLWRAGKVDGGWATNATYELWIAGPEDIDDPANVIDQCVAEFGCPTGMGNPSEVQASANLVTVLPEYLGTHLYVTASCGGSATFICPSGKGDANGYAAVVYLYAADLVLEQTTQPSVTKVGGELETAPTLSGTADLSFHADDSGSGVYQALFTIDGAEAGRTALDTNGGRCKEVGQSTDGLPDFLYLQPCEASLNADVPFDTTALTNGPHHLIVSVSNAAGNQTVVLDRKITVANTSPASGSGTTAGGPSAANGTNASPGATLSVRWGSTTKTTLKGRYGHAQTVLGRLTAPGGVPIAGAPVAVAMTPSEQGARSAGLASPRTASDGSFRLRLPAGAPSGRLTFAYSSHTGQVAPDATASLALTVPAPLSLSVAPDVSHAGGTIAFKGTLHGAPIPPGGKQLVLQARSTGSEWRTFDAPSTDRRGRYHATYRFRLPGPITYEFRAVSRQEADFPYATGTSNVVRVMER